MYRRKLPCLEQLEYFGKSLISNELKKRKEVEDRKEKIELVWTKRRQLFILGHRRWLDEKTAQSGDSIKCRVKFIMKMILVLGRTFN